MTKIEWANETWNPVIGCTKVSPGCVHCYAEKMAYRIGRIEMAATGDKSYNYCRVIDWGTKGWNGKTVFVEGALDKPKKWKKPRMIFICSMSDLFHESVSSITIGRIFQVIAECPQHTFLILTKRPENALAASQSLRLHDCFGLPNVWFGVTAENQEMANKRIPILLQIPAAKRFVSIEPMLSHVIIDRESFDKIDWVICGGMSGTDEYPLNVRWLATLERQCYITKTPFLFKQWGGRNKKRNGRLFGGKLYDEYPVMFSVGDKVHYIPFDGAERSQYQNGIIKSVNENDKTTLFVVYNCNQEWDRYMDYTGQSTKIDQLRRGWI